jgi:hypothetical protein
MMLGVFGFRFSRPLSRACPQEISVQTYARHENQVADRKRKQNGFVYLPDSKEFNPSSGSLGNFNVGWRSGLLRRFNNCGKPERQRWQPGQSAHLYYSNFKDLDYGASIPRESFTG